MADRPPSRRTTHLPERGWVSTAYFAEGLPFMVVRYLAGVYLTDMGLKEAFLGYLNFLGIPWNTKFLWAPAVDLVGTRRSWLVRIELAITLLTAAMAVLAWLGPAGAPADGALVVTLPVRLFVVTLVVLAFVSATHDVSIDGYYMEAIPDPSTQAGYTGLRVMMYRMAVIFAKSVLVALAGWLSWTWGFAAAAVVMGLLFVVHQAWLPRLPVTGPDAGGSTTAPPVQRTAGTFLRDWGRAFVSWLDQPRVVLVIFFILTYKLGDEVLFSMNTPFLMREVGVTKEQLSWLSGVVGTAASIGGSLLSAWAIRRFGLQRAIWPLTLAMNVNIWAYVWLAWALPDPATSGGLAMVAGVHAYEQVAAGLGNAVLVVFLMRTCKPDFKAAHYAIASAIPSLGGTLLGGFGGVAVERFGYLWLYVAAFLFALPSMACMPFLRFDDDRKPTAA